MIFGIDIGTTSIGWAVTTNLDAATAEIRGMGVRIFPEARDPKGLPLNQQRRAARMMRRQTRRRRARRRAFNEALASCGLLPPFGSTEWARVMAMEPYELRRAALERDLSPEELGRVLYHLSKRRHFKARDLEEADAQDETKQKAVKSAEKQELSARETFVAQLRESKATLGAHLASLPPGARKRGHHAERRFVEEEFDAIVERQKAAHPALTNDMASHLRGIVFHQRPVFWRKSTLGKCKLIPGAAPAAKGSWLSQQRRMLEKVNNLAWSGGNARPLDAEERAAILAVLQTQATMTWGGARKALASLYKARGAPAPKGAFNLEASEQKLLGNPLEAKLAAIFGPEWTKHPHKQEIRDACEQLRRADYGELGARIIILSEAERRSRRAQTTQDMAQKFGLDPSQAAQLEKLSFPTGWDAYSVEALNRLLPELEKGVRFGALLNGAEYETWRNATFPQRAQPTGTWVDLLPSAKEKEEEQRLKEVRNPTVVRVLNELRKVINNLIVVYGKPDLIRVELARSVGLSARERDEMKTRNETNEKKRAAAQKDLETKGLSEPSRDDIEKWLLWKECGEIDPYSGARIGFDDLFRANQFDVEHIWPRALSNDDSFANKTLCRKDFNLRKGKRTPFDAFSSDPELWSAMKERIAGMEASKARTGMSRSKIRRFLATEIPADFASRQLNDTGFAARQAVASLKRLWPDEGASAPVRVQTVTGRVTAHLRKLWGLNNILSDDGEKTRADHRHHAIDALVVACAHPGVTQKLSRYWQEKDAGVARPLLTPPWPEIRAQAQTAVESIIVSHRVRKKVSGPLHAQTVYGDTQIERTQGKVVYRRFVGRKPVESLTKSMLEDVRDEQVQTILRDWIAARGGDPKKAFPPYPRLGERGPEIKKARIWVDQQMSLMARLGPKAFADPSSNHHMAIYRAASGAAEYEVVSLIEAALRKNAREPLVRRERKDARFVMSLSPGDALFFPSGEAQGHWVVTGVWASGQIILERLHDATHASVWRPGAPRLLKEGARKVSIDPIGRIRPAGD